jgi:hypothetical protein
MLEGSWGVWQDGWAGMWRGGCESEMSELPRTVLVEALMGDEGDYV